MEHEPMNATILSPPRLSSLAYCLAATCAALLLLSGCHKAPPAADLPSADAKGPSADAKGKAADEKDKGNEKTAGEKGKGDEKAAGEEAGEGVSLKPEEVEKMGIETTAVAAVEHSPESSGYAIVMAHETIAQAVADLATAVAVERQSRAAFARGQKLAQTPGAMPVDTQEAAERQAIVDQAALELTKRRLSSTFGQHPPWKDDYKSPQVAALAGGEIKLVRVTFPLGALGDVNPKTLRLAHLNASRGGKSWTSTAVWDAPADAAVPGRSFFTMLKGSNAGEGERLLAWAPVGAPESGFTIPAAAAVISQGKYWYYVEEKPGLFVRTELDPSMPTADGFFVRQGVAAGDKVVTTSAGHLLARETNPSTAAE
jgi:hypothetical protein